MSEIKFRAWCISERKMYHEVQCAYDYTLMYYPDAFDGEPAPAACFQELLNSDDFIVEQYTGLKDKNGVEIYEGDIVLMHRFLFEGVEVEKQIGGVIGWGEYGVTLRQIRNKYIEEYCGYDAGEGELYLTYLYGLHEDSWEVIGNIHQNPELLEVGAQRHAT